jgi:RNA polymerase-binding transcription factor DksA
MAKASTKAATKRSASTKKAGTKKAAGKAPVVRTGKRATAKKAGTRATVAKTGNRSTVKKAGSRTTVKKAATGKTSTKTAGNGLDKFQEEQLAALHAERSNYLHQAESLQAEADSLTEDREPGDVQFDEESGEGDTLAVERERDLALSAQARVAVEEIDIAIGKIHDGTYGVCETCGSAIPKERLKALPHAALCVKCKSGGLGLRR